MRKVIPVIVFLVVIVLIIVFGIFSGNVGPRSSQSQHEVAVKKALEKIRAYDLDTDYPDNPNEVITINNEIMGYLYGGAASESLIKEMIGIQRMLFGAELLAINPEELQVIGAELEVEKYKEKNYKLIQFKSFPPEYYESNIDNCTVKVIQYTNTEANNYLYYYLSRDDLGLWKIMGWELSDKTFNEAGAVSE